MKEIEIDDDFRPIIVLPCVMVNKYVKFLTPENEITISNSEYNNPEFRMQLLKDALRYFNGNFTLENIANIIIEDSEKENSKYKPVWEDGENVLDAVIRASLYGIVKNLVKIGAVTDSREQYKHFHKVSSYPTTFLRDLSQDEIKEYHDKCKGIKTTRFGETFSMHWDPESENLLINELYYRSSCRRFNENRGIALSKLRDLCRVSYGYTNKNRDHRVVPSAGDLYPLKLYVVVRDHGMTGYYEYDPEEDRLIRYLIPVDNEQLKFCFNSEDMMGASSFIIIAGNFDRQGYKYANRAYRFCLIEAGHVAQNINIHAEKLGFSTCELGGIMDEALRDELKMRDGEEPLLAIAIGHQADPNSEDGIDYAKFVEENVGEGKPVKAVHVWSDGGGFYTATAEYEDHGEIRVGGGTARSDKYAAFKAVVEAYERYASFANDSHARPDNSSGIAAHFDFKEAQKAALAELIERDAIMRCWRKKESPALIGIGLWDSHLISRRAYYSKGGRKLLAFKLESDYAPVVLVTITSNKYPYFVCGAASTVDAKENALKTFQELMNKALLEAESSLLYYINHPEYGRPPRPSQINGPEGHGKLYRMSKRAAERVSWLTAIENADPEIPEWPASFSQLMKDLAVETTVLGEFDNGLTVVQLSSKRLIPMTFGTGSSNVIPHFFA